MNKIKLHAVTSRYSVNKHNVITEMSVGVQQASLSCDKTNGISVQPLNQFLRVGDTNYFQI